MGADMAAGALGGWGRTRLWPLLGGAAVAALCGAAGGVAATRLLSPPAVAAQAQPSLVAAQTFLMQDRAGRSRVLITTLPDGRTGLAFLDEMGAPRGGLGFETTGQPGLAFLSDAGQPRVALGVRADGTPALTLFDRNGQSRVELSVDADGVPRLMLGETLLPLPGSPDALPPGDAVPPADQAASGA